MFVPDIEAAVEDYYRTIEIPPHIVEALRELIGNYLDQVHDIARNERDAYQAEHDDLAQERSKLLQAHYAGAVPIDLLRTEQDRIARRLAFLEAQIDADDIEYDRAKAHLDDCLALAGDCHALYLSLDDSLRRTANQAFFDKLYVTTEDQIDGQPGEPFNVFFNPDVQRLALRPEAEDESGTQTSFVVGLNNEHLVDAMERCGNRQPRVERLVSAWNPNVRGDVEPDDESDDPLIRVAKEPRRRARTRLTDEEVDAMRTAREQGVSVSVLARRFGVHRGTVWAKTHSA